MGQFRNVCSIVFLVSVCLCLYVICAICVRDAKFVMVWECVYVSVFLLCKVLDSLTDEFGRRCASINYL